MNFKEGFTLIELLVAITISAIIMLGVYGMFSNVLLTRKNMAAEEFRLELITKLILLMQKDIRCKTTPFKITEDLTHKTLEFKTTNSLFWNGAVPVTVRYFLKKHENNKIYFYREEIEQSSKIDIKIALTEKIKKIEYMFFNKGKWQNAPSDIIKVCLTLDKPYCFSQRGIIEK